MSKVAVLEKLLKESRAESRDLKANSDKLAAILDQEQRNHSVTRARLTALLSLRIHECFESRECQVTMRISALLLDSIQGNRQVLFDETRAQMCEELLRMKIFK